MKPGHGSQTRLKTDMINTAAKNETSDTGGFWWKRYGLVFIGPRKIPPAGRLRELAAWVAVVAAIALMVIGLLMPQRLGLADTRIIYVAGPALVLAALIHLFLVLSWVRGAWAVVGPGGLKLDGRRLPWSQVGRPRVESVHRQGLMEATLVVDVTWKMGPDQPVETVPLVPAGVTDEADMQRLLIEIRKLMRQESADCCS